MKPRREYKTHPAYGNAVLHRMHGHIGRLYGSPLNEHTTSMRLTISRADFNHDLGQDGHHATEQLIEIEFSPAQFADFITTANVGGGVPCTIRFVQGVGLVPAPPEDEPLEQERVIDSFKKGRKEAADALREGLKNLDTVLAKKTLSKDDKREISWLVGKALQDVESNAPFMLKQFQEATEKLVNSAKAEVAASTQAIVERLGFQKLQELREMGTEARSAIASNTVDEGTKTVTDLVREASKVPITQRPPVHWVDFVGDRYTAKCDSAIYVGPGEWDTFGGYSTCPECNRLWRELTSGKGESK